MLKKRLNQYKSILSQDRWLYQALRRSLKRQEDLDEYDRIFLHVFAPVMLWYVTWVLERASELRIKRLYFLARDGWLMYHLACLIKEQNPRDVDIDLRYIHVSRYVLRNAEYSFIGLECLDTICVGGIDITFEKLMKRAALTDEEILTVAREVGFQNRLKECLSYAQIQELKIKLECHSDNLFRYIQNHSEHFYDITAEYLKQEGLLDDTSYALVDSGWIGTTQKSLQRILTKIKGQDVKVKGFYFGLYEIPCGMDKDCYESFYLRPHMDIKRKTRFSICLFETLFSSPEGMTMKYLSGADGKIKVIKSDFINPNGLFMMRNLELITNFVDAVDGRWFYDVLDDWDGNLKIIEKLLSLIMGRPTIEEASILGGFQFCDDVLELQMQNVAAIWDDLELKRQWFFKKINIKFFNSEEKLHESGWPEASIINLCGEGIRASKALYSERLYKRLMYVRKSIQV